jgi:hypothetical protein
MSPTMQNAAPVLAAVATSPRAIRPPDTAPRKTLARPVDSEIVDERAPCSAKCSVVTNVTAAGPEFPGEVLVARSGSADDGGALERALELAQPQGLLFPFLFDPAPALPEAIAGRAPLTPS